MSATRPWVDAFADEMERKLAENRHKGDRDGWNKETAAWLFDRLRREVTELQALLAVPCMCCGRRYPLPGKIRDVRHKDVRSECADIANFAMMIADVAGGLRPKPTPAAPAGEAREK